MMIVPIWVTCPKCHKKYDRNPSAGVFNCPYCHGLEPIKKGAKPRLFEKKNKDGKQ